MNRNDRFYIASTKAFCMTCGVTIDHSIDIGPASDMGLLDIHEEWHTGDAVCQRCGGSGHLQMHNPKPKDTDDCPDCHGTGRAK